MERAIAEIKPILEKMLSEFFHYQAFVQLYNYNILLNIINKCPFKKEESHYPYVIFIDNETIFEELEGLLESISEPTSSGNQVILLESNKERKFSNIFF